MKGNIQAAIFKYKEYIRNNPDTCILHCKSQKKFSEVIYFACISEDSNGKRHPHQYRLKKENMEILSNHLQSIEKRLYDADNFETLFKLIRNVGSKIDGIGDMLIYDAAERIGEFLNLAPDKIYLHAGTREGAEKILGKIDEFAIKKEMFPEPIRSSNLSCADIESMLCMYKDFF